MEQKWVPGIFRGGGGGGGVKGSWHVKADNLTAICELTV
jgi:hypothetical protein